MVGWHRVSTVTEHRCKQVIHVKIILHALQVTLLIAKICLKDSKNTSRKWSVSVLFIIPVIIDVHGHRFEIYTLVSEIHENVDLVLGIKIVFKLEGVINSRDCCFKFLNRSVPIFPEEVILKLNEQKLIKVKAPFVDEISGMAIIKILDEGT